MTAVREAAPIRRATLAGQVGRFAVIGALSTVLHLGLFAALVRGGCGAQLANGSALVIATIANTAANRAWTFGVTGRERLVTHHGQALVIFGITYVATTARAGRPAMGVAGRGHLGTDGGRRRGERPVDGAALRRDASLDLRPAAVSRFRELSANVAHD